MGFSQLSDDFSDGNFTSNPAWSGDASRFVVNGAGELQLSAPAATDEAYLSTPSQAIDTAAWTLDLTLDFNPSGSNRARIYLVSDQSNLAGSLNGYFVQVGNAEDEVSLYRQTGTATTKIIDGADDLVDTDPVVLSLRVERSSAGLWQLWADTNNSGWQSMGSVVDTVIQTSSYFGLWCDYTSTRSDKFFFDNIAVTGAAYQDTISPTLTDVQATSATKVLVNYSEAMDSASIVNPANYSINSGIGQPSSVAWVNASGVELQLATALTAGSTYELSVAQAQDLAGNSLNTTALFDYYVLGTPKYRSLVINEIMADPTPATGLPELEFLELFNADTLAFDVQDLIVSDASSSTSIEASFILGQGQYVIVCDVADVAAFSPFGDVIGVSSLPAFNNGGDNLSIALNGVLLDQVVYDNGWYGDATKAEGGFTLEQVNPFLPCSGEQNWRASNHSNGGTPGAVNSVYSSAPDTIGAQISSIEIAPLSVVEVHFNEPMDSLSLASAALTLTPPINMVSQQVSSFPHQVLTLVFAEDLDSTTTYVLSGLSATEDCSGNPSPIDSLMFGIGVAPSPFDLIINELQASPSEDLGLPPYEYVEVFNRSNKLLRLNGVQIADESSASFLEGATLAPGAYAIVCDDNYTSAFEPFGKVVPVTTLPSLNNSSDEIRLIIQGTTLDVVRYSATWLAGSNHSLERISTNRLCAMGDNWGASTDPAGGTPGAVNSIAQSIGEVDPQLLGAFFIDTNELEFVFDQQLDSQSVASWQVSMGGDALKLVQQSAVVGTAVFQSEVAFERGVNYDVDVGRLSNCAGQSIEAMTIEAYFHDSSDIAINEILFNPRGSGSDFVELYNTTDHPIGIRHWSLAEYKADGSVVLRDFDEAFPVIAAISFTVLCEDSLNIADEYSNANRAALMQCDLPALSNERGTIVVVDQLGQIIDSLTYYNDWHFPLIDNADGVSLERIDPKGVAHLRDNWHSASSSVGYATPGLENSQYQAIQGSATSFELSNPRISPDNDGFEDVVSVTYSSKQTGLVASIKVMNEQGFEVATIANNVLLGNGGNITWDGTTNDGEKARVGVHVVLIETFDLNGQRQRYKLPLIVAARL